MEINIDISGTTQNSVSPYHGWARNSQGFKLLWLPILRLVHEAPKTREAYGVLNQLSSGKWSEIKAFGETVRHFAITLRELHKNVRIGSYPGFDNQGAEKLNASYEAIQLIPLYVDLSFVYVRRLADHFTRASRYVLFRNIDSAPREYKKLRSLIDHQTNLKQLAPFYDETNLRNIIETHSGWFDKLRDTTDERGILKKGIRDILEHHPVAVNVHHFKLGKKPWEAMVNLGEPGSNTSFRSDLLLSLQDIVSGVSSLWTEICLLTNQRKPDCQWVAPFGDALLLTGNDDDSTGFWPEIEISKNSGAA